MLRDGAAAPFWVTADRQVSGRGRMGRPWVSEPGNLYASLALADPAPAAALPQLGIVIGVALRRAVAAATGATGLALKWPNDLMLAGAKVAGILLEAVTIRGTRHVIAGCGVNCRHHPEGTAYPATHLAAHVLEGKPGTLFPALDEGVRATLEEWRRGAGFPALRDEWQRHAHGLGREARVRMGGGEELRGIARGLAPDGRLILAVGGTERMIAAGDWLADEADG